MMREHDLYGAVLRSGLDAYSKIALAIVIRAIYDTELVKAGGFTPGYSKKELLAFWRSAWAEHLTGGADLSGIITELECVR